MRCVAAGPGSTRWQARSGRRRAERRRLEQGWAESRPPGSPSVLGQQLANHHAATAARRTSGRQARRSLCSRSPVESCRPEEAGPRSCSTAWRPAASPRALALCIYPEWFWLLLHPAKGSLRTLPSATAGTEDMENRSEMSPVSTHVLLHGTEAPARARAGGGQPVPSQRTALPAQGCDPKSNQGTCWAEPGQLLSAAQGLTTEAGRKVSSCCPSDCGS